MVKSKALKGIGRLAKLDSEPEPASFFGRLLQKAIHFLKEHVYYPIDNFINRTYERVCRALAFAKHGYYSYDWDSGYLYSLMVFKLKRIHRCLLNGHAIQEKADMDALKEAIKVCTRLHKDEYDNIYYRIHDKKWGKMKTKTIPEYDDNGKIKHYRWDSSRPKANTPSQKRSEVKDLRKIWTYAEQDRLADLDRLNVLFKNHARAWWS